MTRDFSTLNQIKLESVPHGVRALFLVLRKVALDAVNAGKISGPLNPSVN
jgi:hypothetical protein